MAAEQHSTLTEVLAVWGAVVGTGVAVWNFYKDFVKRDRIKVSAGFRVTMPGDQDVFAITVTNASAQTIRVTHLAGFPHRLHRRKLLRRFLALFRKPNTTGYLFSFQPLHGPRLPAAIPPMDSQPFLYRPENFPEVEDIQVTTADGRNAYCSRSDIREIHQSKAYERYKRQTSS